MRGLRPHLPHLTIFASSCKQGLRLPLEEERNNLKWPVCVWGEEVALPFYTKTIPHAALPFPYLFPLGLQWKGINQELEYSVTQKINSSCCQGVQVMFFPARLWNRKVPREWWSMEVELYKWGPKRMGTCQIFLLLKREASHFKPL